MDLGSPIEVAERDARTCRGAPQIKDDRTRGRLSPLDIRACLNLPLQRSRLPGCLDVSTSEVCGDGHSATTSHRSHSPSDQRTLRGGARPSSVCAMLPDAGRVRRTLRASSARTSAQKMAWTWSCRRAIPDASRRPSIEAVTLDALAVATRKVGDFDEMAIEVVGPLCAPGP